MNTQALSTGVNNISYNICVDIGGCNVFDIDNQIKNTIYRFMKMMQSFAKETQGTIKELKRLVQNKHNNAKNLNNT